MTGPVGELRLGLNSSWGWILLESRLSHLLALMRQKWSIWRDLKAKYRFQDLVLLGFESKSDTALDLGQRLPENDGLAFDRICRTWRYFHDLEGPDLGLRKQPQEEQARHKNKGFGHFFVKNVARNWIDGKIFLRIVEKNKKQKNRRNRNKERFFAIVTSVDTMEEKF